MRLRALICASSLCGIGVLSACKAEVTSLGIWRPDSGARDTSDFDAAGASPSRDAAASSADAAFGVGQYLEAEAGALSGGFTSTSDANASGGGLGRARAALVLRENQSRSRPWCSYSARSPSGRWA